jgi:hypothetical protein
MVLMMVYNNQDYWVFGLCPSSGILKDTKEHTLQNDLVPSSGEGWETSAVLGPIKRANLDDWTAYVSITTAI